MSRVCEEASIALGAFRVVQDGKPVRFVRESFGFAEVRLLADAIGIAEAALVAVGEVLDDSAGTEGAIITTGERTDNFLPISEESVIQNA